MNEFEKGVLALVITLPIACEPATPTGPAPAPTESAEREARVVPEAHSPPVDPPPVDPPPADPLPVFAIARLTHDAAVTDIAWSTDGAVIATASSDGKLRLWDARSYALTRSIDGAPGSGARVAISSDAATVVTNAAREVHVFDLDGGDPRTTLTHDGLVFAVAVSADAGTIASGGVDGLRIWDAEGSERSHVEQRGAQVLSLHLSADGRSLAAGWGDGRVRLIDTETGKLTRTIKTGEAPLHVAYSADGLRVAARTGAADFGIFAATTGKSTATIPLAQPFAFGVGGNLLLATGAAAEGKFAVTLVEVNSGGIVRGFLGHTGDVTDAVFSPDGNSFASASADTTALIWMAP